MSKIRVVFAINDAYTEHLNIAIYSLLKNNPKSQLDIYVLCKSLTRRNQQSIRNITRYFKDTKIEIMELDSRAKRFDTLSLNIQHISIETYYRYILAELFPDFDKVIYIDADILVSGSLKDLYSMDLQDIYLAGVNDHYVAGVGKDGNPTLSPDYKEWIGFERGELYLNAGVLLMNLKKMREDGIVEKLFENTIRLDGKIKFQDQDILNITMQGKLKALPSIFNYTDQAKRDDNAEMSEIKIIHYNGPAKPWDNVTFADFQESFVELYRNYVNEYNELIYGSKSKFALYTHATENIGDDIQSIAARRFLPRIDYYIDRDLVGAWQNTNQKEQVKLVANGWYMHSPYKWPIEDKTLSPLYISMYVEQSFHETVERFLSEKSRGNFKEFGKIGARDEATYDFFKKNDIDAYMSGCLTLTLQKDKNIKKGDFILLTDVSPAVYEYVKKTTKRRIIYLTNATATTMKHRHELAEIYLYLYQSAHCVITERLHSALPCLALETPVLLIKKESPVGGNKDRFAGLSDLTHYFTEYDFLSGEVFDIEDPPKNSKKYLEYRNSLIKTCEEYTGFNNQESFAWTDISLRSIDEVEEELELLKTANLKHATTELMRALKQKDELLAVLGQKHNEIEYKDAEIARLMGIKASALRLAGNIKRRITKGLKYES